MLALGAGNRNLAIQFKDQFFGSQAWGLVLIGCRPSHIRTRMHLRSTLLCVHGGDNIRHRFHLAAPRDVVRSRARSSEAYI